MPVGEKARAPRKRRDAQGFDVRTALLDAAESLMREEGYAAATARRIAGKVELKHQVVFYYFGTHDDLLLALFRRVADTHRARLVEALGSSDPLRGMWQVMSDPGSTKLTLEFLALANHNEAVRAAIAENAEAVRAIQVEALTQHLKARGIEPRLSPQLLTILTSALGRLLVQDANIGIVAGHDEVEALIEVALQRFEGGRDVADAPLAAPAHATR